MGEEAAVLRWLRGVGPVRDPDTGAEVVLPPGYVRWLGRFTDGQLAGLLARPEGRAEVEHLRAFLARVLGERRPVAARTRSKIVWCGCPRCRTARAAEERPPHGPYSVEQVWVPGARGERGQWRAVRKPRGRRAAPGEAVDGAVAVPRPAGPDDHRRLGGSLI